MFAACPKGFYGNQCALKCDCQNSVDCDHVTGRCQCAPGWHGPQCEEG